jgi:dihydrofolate reductase
MTMRKVILAVNVSLDGYLEGPAGELDWWTPDPVMNVEFTADLRAAVDTMLTGRKAYHALHEAFSQQASHPDSPPELVDFATWMLSTPKVVFSRTRAELLSPNDQLAEADIPEAIASLKQRPGKDLVLFGGSSTVQQFVQHRLVDEYRLKIYPVALGAGQPLFTDLKDRSNLALTHTKAYDSGILTLRYQPV